MSSEYYHTKESVEEYIKLAEGVNGAVIINKLTPYLKEVFSPQFEILDIDYYDEFEENDSILLIGRKK